MHSKVCSSLQNFVSLGRVCNPHILGLQDPQALKKASYGIIILRLILHSEKGNVMNTSLRIGCTVDTFVVTVDLGKCLCEEFIEIRLFELKDVMEEDAKLTFKKRSPSFIGPGLTTKI